MNTFNYKKCSDGAKHVRLRTKYLFIYVDRTKIHEK